MLFAFENYIPANYLIWQLWIYKRFFFSPVWALRAIQIVFFKQNLIYCQKRETNHAELKFHAAVSAAHYINPSETTPFVCVLRKQRVSFQICVWRWTYLNIQFSSTSAEIPLPISQTKIMQTQVGIPPKALFIHYRTTSLCNWLQTQKEFCK